MNAHSLWFQIKDEKDNVLIGRTVKFPYPIDDEEIDKEIALIFFRIAERKEEKDEQGKRK